MNLDDLLAAVAQRLSDIQRTLDRLIEIEEKERSRQHERENIPVQVTGTFRLPDAIEAQRAATQDRYYITQKVIAVAACAAFVAALLYAMVTGLQLQEMRKQTTQLYRQAEVENANASFNAAQGFRQLNIAKQEARAAQDSVKAIQHQTQSAERAWITIEFPQPLVAPLAENRPITSNIQFTNSGNSVARKVIAEAVIEVVKNGKSPTFDYSWDHTKLTSGLLQKNETATLPAGRYAHQRTTNGSNAKILPLSHDELQQLLTGKSYIAIFARVRYWDAFGIHHWLRRCGWVAQPSPPGVSWVFTAHKCTNYAEVDNN